MSTKNIQFNIIEGIDETDLFEAIKEDYYNTNLSVEEIRNKHDVSLTKWRTLFIKRLKENNLPLRKNLKANIITGIRIGECSKCKDILRINLYFSVIILLRRKLKSVLKS